MNTATETDMSAYFHETLTLTMTADLRRKLVRSSYVSFFTSEIGGIPSYIRDARRVVLRFDAGSKDERTEVETKCWQRTGNLDATRKSDAYGGVCYDSNAPGNSYCPSSGVWVVHVGDHQRAALESIPTGAEITVEIKLDWHSTCNHAAVGHHGDVLVIKWTKGRRERSINLDAYHGPHNTARFGCS